MKRTIIITLLTLVSMTLMSQTKSGLDLCLKDDATGEWLICFFDDYAVYDGEHWDYKEVKKQGDKIDVTLVNGCELLRVIVGKEKKGKRPVTINSAKKRKCRIVQPEPGEIGFSPHDIPHPLPTATRNFDESI